MFNDLIKNRRSIRKFTDEKIPNEKIEEIVTAALYAPSGRGKNPCEFLVLENKEDIEKAALAKSDEPKFENTGSHIIVILSDKDLSPATYIDDAAICASYMQLKISELGLGSCWIFLRDTKRPDGQMSSQYLKDLFNIPDKYEITQMLVLGYKDEEKGEKTPADFSEKVHFNRF